MEEFSSCGLYDCWKCRFRKQGTCPGCRQGNALLEVWGRSACTIHACTRSQGIETCLDCVKDVCSLRGMIDSICPLRAGAEDKSQWMWRIARHISSRGTPCHGHASLPLKTLVRLRWYLAALERCEAVDVISSRELAEMVGVGSAMVRKDFSHIGEMGTRGVGYRVTDLQERLHGALEQNTCLLVWVGAPWLENALTTFIRAQDLNFRIVAAFDTRPEWIGRMVGPWKIQPLSDLPEMVSDGSVNGVVLALPEEALAVANQLFEAGVQGILNLTQVALTPPSHVAVRHMDLVGELMALAMEVTEAELEAGPAGRRGPEPKTTASICA